MVTPDPTRPDIFFILALPEDPLLNFQITTPTNSDQKATIQGWEFDIQHSFWNTGFGVILNYTIVNGSREFDNTLAIERLSVRAGRSQRQRQRRPVLRQARNPGAPRLQLARQVPRPSGDGANPTYIEAYGQLDGSASYEVRKGITVFAEGINLTGSSRRAHMRHVNNVTFVSPGYARYSAGVRFAFGGDRAPPPPPPPPPMPPPPPPPPAATQTCADGSVILATDACPAPPPPPPPPAPAPERGG